MAVNDTNDLYMKDPRVIADEAEDTEEEETQEEKESRWGTPKHDIVELIKEFEDQINASCSELVLEFSTNE